MVKRALCLMLCLMLLMLLGGCATDSMEQREYGQQLVCHGGNKTLAVSNADSFGHLDHGDTIGPCPNP